MIAAHPDGIETALAAYEAALFPRSEAEAADAWTIQDVCLGDDAPFSFVAFLSGVPGEQFALSGQR